MGGSAANMIQHKQRMAWRINVEAFFVIARGLGLCLLSASCLRAQVVTLKAYPEFLRVDPFGQIVKADRAAGATEASLNQGRRTASLKGARGGYVSFHLVAELTGVESYSLELSSAPGDSGIQTDSSIQTDSGIQTDIYREWFHYLESDKCYYPDALIPIQLP